MRSGAIIRSDSPRPRAVVAVGTSSRDDVAEALSSALHDARVEAVLNPSRAPEHGRTARVVIRPVLPPGSRLQSPPRSYVGPQIIKALLGWLAERGYADLTIAVPGPGGVATARSVGYEGEIVDLTHDTVDVHYGGRLGRHVAARQWRDADVRILVATAQADRQLMYSGGVVSALGTISDSDALARRFTTAYDIAECAGEVLDRFPITFAVIDAWPGAGMTDGHTHSPPARERSVLASTDLFALDWVLGELMGLDGPELNPVVKAQLVRRGAIDIDRWGDLTPWEGWSTPSPLTSVLSQVGAGRPWGRLIGWREVRWTAR